MLIAAGSGEVLLSFARHATECRAKGGRMLQTMEGNLCVKVEVLK